MEELKTIQNNFYNKFSIDTIINILSYISSKYDVLKNNPVKFVFIDDYLQVNYYTSNTLFFNNHTNTLIYISPQYIMYNLNELEETFKIMSNSIVVLIILNSLNIYEYGWYKFITMTNDDNIDNLKTIMNFNIFLISSGIWDDIIKKIEKNNEITFGTMIPSINSLNIINSMKDFIESLN